MSLAKLSLAAREEKNAGSARLLAVRNPRPPYLTGSLACDQLLSSKFSLHCPSVVEHMTLSYSARRSG